MILKKHFKNSWNPIIINAIGEIEYKDDYRRIPNFLPSRGFLSTNRQPFSKGWAGRNQPGILALPFGAEVRRTRHDERKEGASTGI